MSGTFFFLMILTMIAVVAVLVTGLLSMAKGGEFNKKYGNKLMQARIFFQAGALLFFVLAALSMKK